MLKKIGGVVALVGMCALSLFLLNCGSSSSRPSGVVYVLTQGINGGGDTVSSFGLDLDSGELSLVNSNAATCPAATQANPQPCGAPLDIVLDPAGAAAFVLNQGIPCITQANGQCVPTDSSPIAPSIYSYTVNSDGSLSSPGAAVNWTCVSPNGTACSSYYADTAVLMARDDAGQFLFVIDDGVYPYPASCPLIAAAVQSSQNAMDFTGCPSISVFSISGSSLMLVSQSSTYQSPLYLSKIPTSLSAITFTPSTPANASPQELLFVSENYDLCTVSCLPPGSTPNDNALSVYGVSSTGVLSEQPNSPYALAVSNPISVIAVNTTPAGQAANGGVFAFVGSQGSGTGAVNPFQLCTVANETDCSGAAAAENLVVPVLCPPAQTCSVSAGQDPLAMAVDPTNNFLYVLAQSGAVFGFRVNTTQGTLAGLIPTNVPTGSQPVSMAIHPTVNNTGQYLYVSNSNSDSITGFALSTTSGAMSSLPTVITPAAPSGIAVH
jgi:hypothetical protein